MSKNRNTIEKIKTGIKGLDEVLCGGFPEGSLTLLSGGPGTGKTMLGLEFLVNGAKKGVPGIMLTFEERKTDIRRYAKAFGWNIEKLEKENKLALISARIEPDAIHSGDFDLKGIISIILQKSENMQAKRILIDAPDVFLSLLDNIAKERAELIMLNDKMRDLGLTALMTVKCGRENCFTNEYGFLEYIANCVIKLDQRVYEQITTRRLRVTKYRGSAFNQNEYPFSITDAGIWIIPITRASLEHQAFGKTISTGIPDLDVILDGGYRKNSCNLITGSSGTGKTTFISSFVVSTTSKKQKVLYLDFEESWEALETCMRSPGLDLKKAKDSGYLQFISTMPESKGIEEHLIQAFRAIENFNPAYLIVDAISACRRMGSEHSAFDYLLRLINHCKKRNITTLLANLTDAVDAKDEITGIDLSSVIDTVILLTNLECENKFKRELGVIKSRGRKHSTKIHEFHITDNGIKIEL